MFQKLLILSLMLFPGNPIFSQESIKVSVLNLRNNKGHLLISLFRDGVGYPTKPEQAFRKARLTIINRTGTFDFSELPPGNYSVAILHDENDDQKMNKNFLGIPKEGYGFSNNAMGTFGPPSLSRASFSHPGRQETRIAIFCRYGI